MSRRTLTSMFTAAAMAFAVPMLAQEKGQARPNPSGGSTGSAVSRPSGGSGGSGGGGTSSSPSGGSSSGSSVSRPSSGGDNNSGVRAPSRPERRDQPRATPRSSGSSGSDQARRVAPAGSNASASDNNGDRRRAVPAYSRPRDGRTPVGTAIQRTGRPPDRNGLGGIAYYYNPFDRYSYYYNRYPYGYFWPGYGFGVGYFYDPWMWGYYSPYGYGGYSDPYGGYGGGTYSRRQYRETGSLRLKVKPAHGQVYVDGYYVGEVDSFDGVFQRMPIEAGTHRIEIRAEGFEPAQFEVMVIRGETVTYKGELKRQ